MDGDSLQHSYSSPSAPIAVLHCLGGYIVKKVATMMGCNDCHVALKAASDVPCAAILNKLSSLLPDVLKHPSADLTCMLSGIECVIEWQAKSNNVFGCLFWTS